MTIYLLIKPWDYTIADVEVFTSKEEASQTRTQAILDQTKNSEYWVIREEDI